MKRISLAIYFTALSFFLFCFTASSATHDTSLDNKSIRSLTFDDANTTGTVKIKAVADNTSDYIVTIPAENGTVVTTASTGLISTLSTNTVQSSNINWSNVNGLGPINTGGINWTSINSAQTISTALASQAAKSSNINWSDIQAQEVGKAGVNWTFQPNNTDGVNWTAVSNNAATNNIPCWKSNGQLGKCGTSISGVNCTACN